MARYTQDDVMNVQEHIEEVKTLLNSDNKYGMGISQSSSSGNTFYANPNNPPSPNTLWNPPTTGSHTNSVVQPGGFTIALPEIQTALDEMKEMSQEIREFIRETHEALIGVMLEIEHLKDDLREIVEEASE
jgi:hypothetical protein